MQYAAPIPPNTLPKKLSSSIAHTNTVIEIVIFKKNSNFEISQKCSSRSRSPHPPRGPHYLGMFFSEDIGPQSPVLVVEKIRPGKFTKADSPISRALSPRLSRGKYATHRLPQQLSHCVQSRGEIRVQRGMVETHFEKNENKYHRRQGWKDWERGGGETKLTVSYAG